MNEGAARGILMLAARLLGPHRRSWARAMQAELDVAIAHGEPLSFALGCLFTAWRELPAQAEGRFALASHAFALGLVVPFAALALSGAMLGYPYLAFGHVTFADIVAGASEQLPLLNDGSFALAPALSLLVVVLAVSQLLLAWHLLEQDWSRTIRVVHFNSAAVATLTILVALLGLGATSLVLPIAGLAIEALVIWSLSQWHDRLPDATWCEDPGG